MGECAERVPEKCVSEKKKSRAEALLAKNIHVKPDSTRISTAFCDAFWVWQPRWVALWAILPRLGPHHPKRRNRVTIGIGEP
jgi:hypothetical protein